MRTLLALLALLVLATAAEAEVLQGDWWTFVRTGDAGFLPHVHENFDTNGVEPFDTGKINPIPHEYWQSKGFIVNEFYYDHMLWNGNGGIVDVLSQTSRTPPNIHRGHLDPSGPLEVTFVQPVRQVQFVLAVFDQPQFDPLLTFYNGDTIVGQFQATPDMMPTRSSVESDITGYDAIAGILGWRQPEPVLPITSFTINTFEALDDLSFVLYQGDFNGDGFVDHADYELVTNPVEYTQWRDGRIFSTITAPLASQSIPEPATWLIVVLGAVALGWRVR